MPTFSGRQSSRRCNQRRQAQFMGKALVIVESPAKAKTINKYLGKDFIVKSSVGHIRDLPTSGSAKPTDPKERAAQAAITRKMAPDEKVRYQARKKREQLVRRMGIDPDNGWQARYEILPGKKEVVSELKKLAKDSDAIYLATDLDRRARRSPGICRKRSAGTSAVTTGGL
ncbi:MAG: hypothetical protein CM15mP103_10020 [Gammaproteobacteria bacterium]|nr:MAG: hypothetical protein CM15mP103_10020 [Gammaproteobacteria bacterium]